MFRCSSLAVLLATIIVVIATESTIPSNDMSRIVSGDKCTAIAVGKSASASGSPMTTQTADCAECDWRVNKVPARDWPEGAMRPIYLITGSYPRQVREDRGLTWTKSNLERNMPQRKEWEKLEEDRTYIIGYIPQVNHTFALIEGSGLFVTLFVDCIKH